MSFEKVFFEDARGMGLKIGPNTLVFSGELAYVRNYSDDYEDTCMQLIRFTEINYTLAVKYVCVTFTPQQAHKHGVELTLRTPNVHKIPERYKVHDYPDEWLYEMFQGERLENLSQLGVLGFRETGEI